MNMFKQIIRSGVSDSDDYLKKRGVILCNYISLILCASIILLSVIRLAEGRSISQSLLTGFVLFLIPIFFNRLSWTTLSRLYLCYVPVGFLWYTFVSILRVVPVVETSMYDGLRILLLAVSFIPYLLLEKDKLPTLLLGILPTLISFLFFEYILSGAGVGSREVGILGKDYQFMQIRGLVSYLIVSASCYAFLYVITQNDKYNQELVTALKNKSEEIEMQNEEMAQSQEMLNELNLHLEELVAKKTHNIELQNEKLIKYAHSNAHYVRGPIARLLGLIQLSKLDTEIDYCWYFEKMEHETNEIDKITKRIAEDLNNPDVGSINEAEVNRGA
jgi:signal transduction histidine kinase